MAEKQTAKTPKKKLWSPSEFKDVQELQEKCSEYFKRCDEHHIAPGEGGLAYFIGVTRETLQKWYDGVERPEFQDTIRRQYLRIQANIESNPIFQQKGMVPRSIFLLKQQRLGGYQDKTEQNHDINVHVSMGPNMDASDFD